VEAVLDNISNNSGQMAYFNSEDPTMCLGIHLDIKELIKHEEETYKASRASFEHAEEAAM